MARKDWTRDELLLALNLYYQIPFGRQHSRAPEIIDLANRMERTPGSVAMKLNNLTSLDPDEIARGVKGLEGASTQDRKVWDEFHADIESMTAFSEHLWEQLHSAVLKIETPVIAEGPSPLICTRDRSIAAPTSPFTGPLDTERKVRVRLAQNFFRRTVLSAYGVRCCITGLDVPELLRASHIVPWGKDPNERLNPRNGLCLSALHDAAFDRHLITFNPDSLNLVITQRLKASTAHDILNREFLAYEEKALLRPERFIPDARLMQQHYQTALARDGS